jgi:hypothetical protein
LQWRNQHIFSQTTLTATLSASEGQIRIWRQNCTSKPQEPPLKRFDGQFYPHGTLREAWAEIKHLRHSSGTRRNVCIGYSQAAAILYGAEEWVGLIQAIQSRNNANERKGEI